MTETAQPLSRLLRAVLVLIGIALVWTVARTLLFPVDGKKNYQAIDEPTIRSWAKLASAIRPTGSFKSDSAELKAACLNPSTPEERVMMSDLNELDARILVFTRKFGEPPLSIDYRVLNLALVNREDCASLVRNLPRLLWTDLSRQQASDNMEQLDWYFLHKASEANARHASGDFLRVPSRLLAKSNPWSNAQLGCLFAHGAGGGIAEVSLTGARRLDCSEAASRLGGSRGTTVVKLELPDISTILRPLDMVRKPDSVFLTRSGLIAESAAADAPNRGLDALLTIDPEWQASAQKMALCFVGAPNEDCKGITLPEDMQKLVANEPARMLAIALVDSETGGILALASANSHCLVATHLGQDLSGCPKLGNARNYRPDRLVNRAYYGEAMPASTIKPLIALGSLASPHPMSDTWLNQHIPPSNSKEFLRVFTCSNLPEGAPCAVPQLAQKAATELGWNRACKDSKLKCGLSNYLFGAELGSTPQNGSLVSDLEERPKALAASIASGTFMVHGESGGGLKLIEKTELEVTKARKCAPNFVAAGCQIDEVDRAIINQGWGQGDLKSSPLGVAELYANLARTSEGKQPSPAHLVSKLYDASGRQALDDHLRELRSGATTAPSVATPERAQRVLQAMTKTHIHGTAARACKRLSECDKFRGLHSKTGSVTAPKCHRTRGCLNKLEIDVQRGSYVEIQKIPYRWYAGVFEEGGRKLAFAVLAERNWRTDGVIQSENENVAALAGLQFVFSGRNIKKLGQQTATKK